jgi:DNA polymerase-4/DNA polymerase V
MRISEIKKACPEAILLPSDYETYSLLSKRLFSIVRRFTPEVEEYGVDECFADLTGLRRPLHKSYEGIIEEIKSTLAVELGFTFSLGLAPNKVLAKIASKWKKPAGLTIIPSRHIHLYLEKLPVEKVWGIGPQTTAYLNKQGVNTALELAVKDEAWVKKHLIKPFYEIWQELRGQFILKLQTQEKTDYQTIQKVKTFTPASRDRRFVFSQLSKNIENACIKARRYKLAAQGMIIFLRTQDFSDIAIEIKFSHASCFPNEIIKSIEPAFDEIFNPNLLFRSTGVVLLKLKEQDVSQPDLFGEALKVEKMDKLFQSIDEINKKFGKHTVFLGTSFWANRFSQHLGERGDIPQRKIDLLKGETARKRLAIPRFMGKVN